MTQQLYAGSQWRKVKHGPEHIRMKSARNASREMLAAHVPACLSTSLALCQHGPKSDATWTPKYMRVHFTNWAHSFRKSWPWTRAGHHHHHRGGSALVQPPQLCISDHSMNGQPDSTSIIIDGRPISLVRVCVQDLLIRYIVQLGHASHLLIREKLLILYVQRQSALKRVGSMYSRIVPIILFCIYL